MSNLTLYILSDVKGGSEEGHLRNLILWWAVRAKKYPDNLPGIFSSISRYVLKKHYMFRLSITREALPSCLGILFGSTSLTVTPTPSIDSIRFSIVSRKAFCRFISSKKMFSVTSILTSSTSMAPFRSTTS